MDDLVQFLRARLDEDEQTARAAGGRWMVLPVSGWVHTAPAPSDEWQHPGTDHHVASVPLDSDRAHIVRHDPARILAEVAWRRLTVDNYATLLQTFGHVDWAAGKNDPVLSGTLAARETLHSMLRGMATASYADHPDYRTEWQPSC
ncbi:DUF6221 family protein [Streptomyces vinaceus]|uniref:DUF6221 family protein n=1 Tax=Streptomyces vinaceus TaxID=1960 RepID=UPI0036C59DBE